MTRKRTTGDNVKIDDEDVKKFFDNRRKKSLQHRYNYVNYQDDNPELVIQRDAIEKSKVVKFMPISPEDDVLDIGCGVGRWGDYVVPILGNGSYIGIDYTQDFIDIAKEHFRQSNNARFYQGSFQEVKNVLSRYEEISSFTKILVNGVLMYINDEELALCLQSCEELLKTGGFLYIRESVGINARLTLNNFYSSSLEMEYSGIYRSLLECTENLFRYFSPQQYALICCMPTWEEEVDYEKETTNYIWILRKMKK